jgi:hypothetical protein
MRPNKEEREKYFVDYPQDTDFSAYARLLQSKWREKMGYPRPESKLGNYIETEFAKKSRANFLTEKIRELVTQEVANVKKNGGLIGEPRIWNNLLSSQPLCFNLFGELSNDEFDLATKLFKKLFPDRIDEVTAIKFEYSPGRGNPKYIGDHSAFDVFIEYNHGRNKGFIGIEVKYAESLKEETKEKANKNFKEQYATLTNSCGLFKPNSVEFLRQPPLSQIWRDHLLSVATKQDYDEGFFVFLYPSKNHFCQKGIERYKEYLAFENESQNGFYPRFLEDFIGALTSISDDCWVEELKLRYLGEL